MTDRTRRIVLALTLVVILAAANTAILDRERVVAEGTTMLLRLAPRDPRSLLQGDYMALDYAIAREVASAAQKRDVLDGVAVVALDESGEATFVRIDDGGGAGTSRRLLRFRKRGDTVRVASDAYFFEEGTADAFESARFGELRVDADGDAVLVGLRDAEGRRLGPRLHEFD